MAEDIGFEPLLELDEAKPKKKAKKAERSAPVKSEPEETTAVVVKTDPDAPLSKTAKRKLKRKLAIERKEKGEPEEKKSDKKDDQPDKPKYKGKDKNLSFEVIEKKFEKLLDTLTESTNKFKEGEELIKKEVEAGKVTKEESDTLFRVYNRRLRIKNFRAKLIRFVGEHAELDAVKERVNIWIKAGKITKADAGLLVKRWKGKEHRRLGRQNEKINSHCCFHCREPGHMAAQCPKKNSSDADGICFKCGSTEHQIQQCKKKNIKGFPYATCFVCKQVGHISRDCHANQNGVYPDGGSCNVCGSNAHLKRDCPELAAQKAGGQPKKQFTARAASNWASESADADYDPTSGGEQQKSAKVEVKKAKHIKF